MSKSEQHFFLIEDVARQVEPQVIRFYLQSTHYRSPIEWSEERLREAGTAYARLRAALATGERAVGAQDGAAAGSASARGASAAEPTGLQAEIEETARLFEESMDDDFNSAKAQGHLFDLAKAINRVAESDASTPSERAALPEASRTLRRLGETLGLFWGAQAEETAAPDEVQALVRQRDEARLQKQWQRADDLRAKIEALGYVLEDQKGGTRARRKP